MDEQSRVTQMNLHFLDLFFTCAYFDVLVVGMTSTPHFRMVMQSMFIETLQCRMGC